MRPRVELFVGMSGSGKSTEMFARVGEAIDDGERVLLLNTTGEEIGELEGEPAGSVAEAFRLLARDVPLVVVVPPRDMELGPPRRDEIPLVEAVAYACLNARDVTLAITEVHMHVPEGAPLGRQTRTLLTQYRHYECAVLADTQRFAAVAKPLVSQASAMHLFAMAGARDLQAVSDLGGPALEAAVLEAARQLAAREPGWHATIDARHPPVRPKLRRREV